MRPVTPPPAPSPPATRAGGRLDLADWGDPAKVLLVSGLLLPFGLMWLARLFVIEDDATVAPYVSRPFIPVMKAVLTFQAVGHALLMLAALATRRSRTVRWLVEAEVQLWFACTAFSIYAVGHFTSAMGVMFLVLPVVGYLLFDGPVMNRGLATGVTLTVLGVALPLAGVVPYSPFLAHAPWSNGRVELGWMLSQGVPLTFATVEGLALYTSLLRAYRARRYGLPISVLMLDVDHFKAINDTRGHQAGDEVLRRLGQVVREGLRVVDVAARYGGEELAVLLPHTALDGARIVARRLLAAARGVPVAGGGAVTVSLGVAQWSPGEAADALVARADVALYEAKRAGRDRACEAGSSTSAATRG